MTDAPTYVVLLAALLIVGGLFAAHVLLIVTLRALRLAQEAHATRVRRRASWPLARYLANEQTLEEVCSRLGRLSPRPIRRLLLEHVHIVDGDTRARLEVLYRKLGLTDIDRMALGSRRWWVQLDAARAFGSLTWQGPLEPLASLLDHERESVRLAAARALGRVGTPEAIRTSLSLLGRVSPLGLIELVAMLRDLGDRAVEPLRTVLFTTEDARVRADGAEVAGELSAPALLPVLLNFSEDEDLEVLIRTARALGHFPDPGTPAVVRRLLEHPAWQVRAQAAKSLGRLGDPVTADRLAVALTDPNWWVRLNAAVALRRLGPVGEGRLRRVRHGTDAYAAEMAQRVLRVPVDRTAV